jgi:hypothetical protein
MTEAEWRDALRLGLTYLRSDAVLLRNELEKGLAQPKERGKPRHFEITMLPRVAADLRMLVGQGKGNRLLFRAADRFAVPKPTADRSTVVADPRTHRRTVVVASPGASKGDVALEDCMAMGCLIVRDASIDERWTWSQIISAVANKTGSHVDDERPISWDRLQAIQVGGTPVLARLFFQFGCLVVDCGNEVLGAIGEGKLEPLDPLLGGMSFGSVSAQWG